MNVPGLGKQTLLIGSAAHCDIRLGGPGVAPEHARIVHQGGGALLFVDNGTGQTYVNGAAFPPGSSTPFDFRAQFAVGHTPIPNGHPAITLALMEIGKAPLSPGQLTFGRDPARVNVVISHPNVSSHHATFQLSPLAVIDRNSTAGTWIGQERLAPEQPRPLDPHAYVALGPIAVPAGLVLQLAQVAGAQPAGGYAPVPAAAAIAAGAPAPATGLSPQHAAAGAAPSGDGGAPRAKHKTVVGQIQLGPSTQASGKSIGRTPENDIQIPHPQVSSRHALIPSSAVSCF